MHLLIGKENCSRCDTIKNIFNNRGIEFEYKLLDSFSCEEKEKYLSMAREAKQFAMPIIILNDKVIDFKEVI
jgi:glutaredoxin